jgi:hypothetical protein
MRIFERISVKFAYSFFLVFIFLFYVVLLYGLIQGNYGPTFSPLQPDSTQYICRGIEMAKALSLNTNSILAQLSSEFRSPADAVLTCGPTSLLYESRVLLPFLISLTTLFDNLWLLFLPTLIFAGGSLFLWWKLTERYVMGWGVPGIIVGVAPWLSPHFGGHVFLVLTEGPLVFLLLSILICTNKHIMSPVYFLVLFVISCLGVLNRQSWPILAIFLAYSLVTRFDIKKNLKILLVFLASFIFCFIQNNLLTNSISQSIDPFNAPAAFYGILMGLLGDFIHVLRFVDLPGILVLCIMGMVFLKVRDLKVQIASVLLLLVSLYSQGAIYLFDSSFSQNWRYYLPNGFFAIYVYLIHTQRQESSLHSQDLSR